MVRFSHRRLSVYMYVYLSICMFTRVYVRLPEYMYVYPSICTFTRVYILPRKIVLMYVAAFLKGDLARVQINILHDL